MPHKKFVLFDFDGVIADSLGVCVKTARTLCAHITEEEYRRAFEGNIYETHRKMMPSDHGPECHHDHDWFEVYIPIFEKEAKLFHGLQEVVSSLARTHILIIVSSSVNSPIEGFLEKHHLGRYFSEVMGHDVHTHKAEKIRIVFEKYETTSGECVFVTDTLGDMREATQMNVGAIGVTWGWHSRETLEKGKPFRIVDAAADIPGAVSDYFAEKSGVSA